MRGLWACGALLVFAGGLGAQDDRSAEGVEGLATAFSRAWGQHEPAALADLWLADGDLMNPLGRRARGRAELIELFRDEHNGYMKGTSLAVRVTSLRVLTPSIVFFDAEALLNGVRTPDGKGVPPLKHVVFAVAVERDGAWRFASARLSVPVPPPPSDER
jgi:uncharacterized protein (TIGR02246 family)